MLEAASFIIEWNIRCRSKRTYYHINIRIENDENECLEESDTVICIHPPSISTLSSKVVLLFTDYIRLTNTYRGCCRILFLNLNSYFNS